MSRVVSASPARAAVLASLAVLALVAVGAWRWHAPAAPASAAVDDDSSGVGILLQLAGRAVDDGRLVAPAGSNAYEFYLSVLQLEPANPVAQDSLHRLLPSASAEVEHSINQLELDEAARELRLLQDFDADNYTLALLGGKLDAQRQLVVRQDEQRAAALHAGAGLP